MRLKINERKWLYTFTMPKSTPSVLPTSKYHCVHKYNKHKQMSENKNKNNCDIRVQQTLNKGKRNKCCHTVAKVITYSRPGVHFSKDSVTYRARKAIL